MREIRVILEKGKWHIETDGYKGDACLQDTDKLLAFLRSKGIELDTLNIKHKPEMTEVAKVVKQKQRT